MRIHWLGVSNGASPCGSNNESDMVCIAWRFRHGVTCPRCKAALTDFEKAGQVA